MGNKCRTLTQTGHKDKGRDTKAAAEGKGHLLELLVLLAGSSPQFGLRVRKVIYLLLQELDLLLKRKVHNMKEERKRITHHGNK